MAKKSRKLLEDEAGLPGSPEDPDMGAATPRREALPPIDVEVSEDDAVLSMTDVMGGSGDAKARSKRIMARFAMDGWRIVTQAPAGFEKFDHDGDGRPGGSLPSPAEEGTE